MNLTGVFSNAERVKQNAPVVWQRASSVINAREKRSEARSSSLVRTTSEHGNQLLRGRESCRRGVLLAQAVRCSSFRPVPDSGYRWCRSSLSMNVPPFLRLGCHIERSLTRIGAAGHHCSFKKCRA